MNKKSLIFICIFISFLQTSTTNSCGCLDAVLACFGYKSTTINNDNNDSAMPLITDNSSSHLVSIDSLRRTRSNNWSVVSERSDSPNTLELSKDATDNQADDL